MYGMDFIWPFEVFLEELEKREGYTYSFSLGSETHCLGTNSRDYIEKKIVLKPVSSKKQKEYRFEIATEITNFSLDAIKFKQQSFFEKLHALTAELDVSLTRRGLLTAIHNRDKIIAQWKVLKPKLLSKYKGRVVEVYINALENKLYDEKAFLRDIAQNRLLGFLWNNQYQIYGNTSKTITKTKEHLHAIAYFPLYVKETLTWVGDEEASPIPLAIQGVLDEKTPVSTIKKYFRRKKEIKEHPLELKKYSGHYFFNKETGWIEDSDFVMQLGYGEDYLKTQHIKLQKIL